MPINDPVKRNKVAPASLAFETRRNGGQYGISLTDSSTGNVTYQQFITNNYRIGFNITVNQRQQEAQTRALMTAMSNAEHRAKHYASDWHHCFEWDTNTTSYTWTSVTANGAGYANILHFNNEVVRGQSIQNVDSKWQFTATEENSGQWLVSAMIAMRFSPNDKIKEARLVLHKNGLIYRNIDITNETHYDKDHIEELVMQGTGLVPLAPGDRLEIAVYLKDLNGPHSGTLAAPLNYYGYVCGTRARCDSDTINLPRPGTTFNNVP